ncbi:beta strand repeat-containing protein [Haloarchaeobius litoreus]|uniref:Beta strand repeat-containing protein n=1 Tax=Haloarchaeobius litoreus TaxID=755306 RepID=A0ABD6DLS4_9EURY|nr:BGTF surface domain-containing protein [Haloarchaeobius litoreus]
MTGTKNKVRGLFLAALMITSVFAGVVAFSGSVAAAANDDVTAGDVTTPAGAAHNLSNHEVGETVSHTFTFDVTVAEDTPYNNVTVDLSETVQDAGFALDSYTVSKASGSADLTVTDEGLSGTDLMVGVEDTNNGSGGDKTATVQVDATLEVTDDTTSESRVDHNIEDSFGNSATVSYKTYYEGSTHVVETVGFIEDTEVYAGETITVNTTGENTGVAVWALDSDGTRDTRVANKDTLFSNVVNIDTSGYDAGTTYQVVIGGATPANSYNFSIFNLNLNVDSPANVTLNEGVSVDVTSDNPGGAYAAYLFDASDDDSPIQTTSGTFDGDGNADVSFGVSQTGEYYVVVEQTATGITATSDTINVTEGETGSASFASNLFTQQIGDVSTFTVDLDATSTARVAVGSSGAGYQANLTVSDEDGDGQVMVNINTFAMGDGDATTTYSAVGDDQITDYGTGSAETNLRPGLIDTGTYDIQTIAGTGSYDFNSQAVATLDIGDRSTNELNIWTAPAAADLSGATAGEVIDAADAGTVTQDDTIALGDYLIHEFDAEGLSGALASNGQAGNATDQFFGLAGTDNLSVLVAQTNPDQNKDPKVLNIAPSNTEVIADAENDTYYLVTDTSSLTATRLPVGTSASPADGDNFLANVSVGPDSYLALETETQTAQFGMEARDGSVDLGEGDVVRVESAENQTISGSSTLAAGSQLTIRVQGTDEGVSFLKPTSATVQEDGSWSTSVDFSDVSANSTFTVTVRSGGQTLASPDGIVGEAAAPAAFEVSDLSAPGTATVGDEVTATATVANTGGEEGTTTVEFTFGGDVVDSQEVTLAPGESTTVEFSITADVDAGTYTHGISAGDSSQTAEITINAGTATPTQTATPTATQTATPTATATATPTDAPTDDPTETDDGDDGGQPGFGIGVALVALMGAALLALRRQN